MLKSCPCKSNIKANCKLKLGRVFYRITIFIYSYRKFSSNLLWTFISDLYHKSRYLDESYEIALQNLISLDSYVQFQFPLTMQRFTAFRIHGSPGSGTRKWSAPYSKINNQIAPSFTRIMRFTFLYPSHLSQSFRKFVLCSGNN